MARQRARASSGDVQANFDLATLLPKLAELEERERAIELYGEAIASVKDMLAHGRIDTRYQAFVDANEQKLSVLRNRTR